MAVIGALLRVFSYLYHLILGLFLLGIGVVALASRSATLQMDMLPWEGDAARNWLIGLGLFGIIAVTLAFTGKLRLLLPIQALAILVLMFWGFFLSRFSFPSDDSFYSALYLTMGALLAFFGAVSVMRRRA